MVYMVDIGVLLHGEVVGISSWGGVYYVQITISWQGGCGVGRYMSLRSCCRGGSTSWHVV
jgi:hypothetical protein